MKIPTTEECKKLWDEFNMPENIRQHTLQVNRLAMLLAKKLKQAGVDIDLELVNAASLLHDLDKAVTLDDLTEHGSKSERWLAEREHKKVGAVVRKHILEHLHEAKDVTWEDKVVNYSDKRVVHNNVVSLKQRFEYLKKRYGSYHQEWHEKKLFAIEKEIFDKIDMNPEDLK